MNFQQLLMAALGLNMIGLIISQTSLEERPGGPCLSLLDRFRERGVIAFSCIFTVDNKQAPKVVTIQ